MRPGYAGAAADVMSPFFSLSKTLVSVRVCPCRPFLFLLRKDCFFKALGAVRARARARMHLAWYPPSYWNESTEFCSWCLQERIEWSGFYMYIIFMVCIWVTSSVYYHEKVRVQFYNRFRVWHHEVNITPISLDSCFLFYSFHFCFASYFHRLSFFWSIYVSIVISPTRNSSSEILLPPPFIRHVL